MLHSKERLHTTPWAPSVFSLPLCKVDSLHKEPVEIAQRNYRVIYYFYFIKAFTLNPKP